MHQQYSGLKMFTVPKYLPHCFTINHEVPHMLDIYANYDWFIHACYLLMRMALGWNNEDHHRF